MAQLLTSMCREATLFIGFIPRQGETAQPLLVYVESMIFTHLTL